MLGLEWHAGSGTLKLYFSFKVVIFLYVLKLKLASSLVTSLKVFIYILFLLLPLSSSFLTFYLLQIKWRFSQRPFLGLPVFSLSSVSLAISFCQLSPFWWPLFTSFSLLQEHHILTICWKFLPGNLAPNPYQFHPVHWEKQLLKRYFNKLQWVCDRKTGHF